MNIDCQTKSPHVSDEVRKTTCYMCACRCGIDVHVRDGRVRYIQGNRDHPVNRGVLCAKGSAGMLHLESPARLQSPLMRTGPRGAGEFREVSWDEALDTACAWLGEIRSKDPRKLAFYTGRDQSQSLTAWWAQQFGTPNYASHGGFCSVNMAAAGIYSIGGSFWEFAQPDWERTRLLLLFGVAEDHDSNPIKLGLSALRRRGARIVSINPVRTGYSAIADTWLGVTPGADGLLVLSLVRELLRSGRVDSDFLRRHTNAGWLVVDGEGESAGLFARDEEGNPLVVDGSSGKLANAAAPGAVPLLAASVDMPDGSRASTVFSRMAAKYLDNRYAPETVAPRTGVSASAIRGLAAELARTAFDETIELPVPWTDVHGNTHPTTVGRPVAIHAMRGISAHGNGFQTCRSLHLLQMLLGAVDCPGGTRFKAPYPKPVELHPRPSGFSGCDTPLAGPPLGYPLGPDDLLVDAHGNPQRLDKAYSWEAPMAGHGMLHAAIPNAAAGDPYPVDVMFLYMANMAWNSSMNTPAAIEALTARGEDGAYRIPKLIVADAFNSETTSYADLVLPDTTYLERHDCISLLDRPIGEPDLIADAVRQPVVELTRNVRPFQDVLIEIGGRLKLPGFVTSGDKPRWRDYAHYMVTREVVPGIGPLAGWRGRNGDRTGRGEPNPQQLEKYVEAGCFWSQEIPSEARFFKNLNRDYQEWAVNLGLLPRPAPFQLQIYSEPLRRFQLAAEGFGERQPPDELRQRIREKFDPFPIWYDAAGDAAGDYPLHAITQRPMAMYHSWGSHNPWLRQLHADNSLYVPGPVCDAAQLTDGCWAWLESPIARIKVRVKRMEAVNGQTVWSWNAVAKRPRAWGLSQGAPESRKSFLLNHVISDLLPEQPDGCRWSNSDPITGQAAWFDLRVSIRRADDTEECAYPQFTLQGLPPGLEDGPPELRYGEEWT
ncbi:MAG: molybdopterin-dependent oxidoreductase [Rhodobacteraceae bacterium]|nr:molybdopterin-dependent oxidoreductase [Paracoccaceae bacterium]